MADEQHTSNARSSTAVTPHLVPEYHRARVAVVVCAGLVFLWRFGIRFTGRIPLLNIEFQEDPKMPYVLACVLGYGFVRLFIEWVQSEPDRRRRLASRLDLVLTVLIGGAAAILLAADIVVRIQLPSVSVISALALIAVGIMTGSLIEMSIWDLFVIRSRQEAERLALPRVPVAVRANLRSAIVVLPLLLVVVALAPSFSSPMSYLWPWFLVSPVVIIVGSGLIVLASPRYRQRNGTWVTRKEYFQSIREAFDHHDTCYQIGGWDRRIPPSNTPLYQAAERGDTATVRELLNHGANPDEPNMHGWRALMIAVANQHEDTAKFLLEAGANPNVCNLLGRNALMFAARYGNEKLIRLLLRHGAKPDLNESYDPSALSSAAAGGHLGAVQLLLNAGADPTLRDKEGRRTQDYAEESGHGEIAALLRRVTLERQCQR